MSSFNNKDKNGTVFLIVLFIIMVILLLITTIVISRAQVVVGRVGVFRDSIYVNGVWRSNFNVLDTSSVLATKNYVNNRYTGGTGISVNNSTGVITNTGVVTETDPVANAKSITVSAGYGLSGGGTNTVGNNPSFTLSVDTSSGKLATQNYVNNRYTGGTGISVNNSTGVINNTGVTSFNGRTGAVVPATGDYNINQLAGVSISSPTTNQLLRYDGTNWVNWTPNYLPASNINGTTNYVAKFTGSNTLGNSIIYDNGTNVGIGTATPGAQLDVEFPDGSNDYSLLDLRNSTNYGYMVKTDHIASRGATLRFVAYDYNVGSPTTRNVLTLRPEGNVGIGTTTPGQMLDVSGNVKFTGALMPNNSAGTTGQVLTSQGAGSAPIWTNISSQAWSLTGNAGTTAGTNFIGTTDSVDMVFKTKNIENMRITATGNVGIGTTTPAQKLDVNGSISFTGSLMPQGDAGINGSVLTSNGAGFYPIWSVPFYINEPGYQTVTTIISDGATISTSYNVTICKFNATTPNVNLPTTSLNNTYFGKLRIVVYNFTNNTLSVNPNDNLINGSNASYSIPVGAGKTFQWSGDGTIGWMVY